MGLMDLSSTEIRGAKLWRKIKELGWICPGSKEEKDFLGLDAD